MLRHGMAAVMSDAPAASISLTSLAAHPHTCCTFGIEWVELPSGTRKPGSLASSGLQESSSSHSSEGPGGWRCRTSCAQYPFPPHSQQAPFLFAFQASSTQKVMSYMVSPQSCCLLFTCFSTSLEEMDKTVGNYSL